VFIKYMDHGLSCHCLPEKCTTQPYGQEGLVSGGIPALSLIISVPTLWMENIVMIAGIQLCFGSVT
jgi:hypothetical protein